MPAALFTESPPPSYSASLGVFVELLVECPSPSEYVFDNKKKRTVWILACALSSCT